HLTIQTKHAVTDASPMMKEEKSKNLLKQQQETAEA
ncbi:30S ribosomal protein S6, partial [Neisseria sp. P0019.S003]